MDNEALLELAFHGREERNLEYKQSMIWDEPATKAKITKSAMAMANLPDGGAIVLGVKENGETYSPIGMEIEHEESFKQDDVMDWVNGYADPYIELTVTLVSKDNKAFVVIQVREFDQLPVVCKKDGKAGLKRGAFFTRSRRKYETTQIGSQTEMREILDLAVDKEIRRLRSRRLISPLTGIVSLPEADRNAFEQQLGGL